MVDCGIVKNGHSSEGFEVVTERKARGPQRREERRASVLVPAESSGLAGPTGANVLPSLSGGVAGSQPRAMSRVVVSPLARSKNNVWRLSPKFSGKDGRSNPSISRLRQGGLKLETKNSD